MEWAVSIPPLGTRQLCTPLAVSARAADFVFFFFLPLKAVNTFSLSVCVCVKNLMCKKRGKEGCA